MSEGDSEIPQAFKDAFEKDEIPPETAISDTFSGQMTKGVNRYLDYKDNPELVGADYPTLKGHEEEVLEMARKAATEERPAMAGMYSPETAQLFGWYAEDDKERIAKASAQPVASPPPTEDEWGAHEQLEKHAQPTAPASPGLQEAASSELGQTALQRANMESVAQGTSKMATYIPKNAKDQKGRQLGGMLVDIAAGINKSVQALQDPLRQAIIPINRDWIKKQDQIDFGRALPF
jgi:hypothetical protein